MKTSTYQDGDPDGGIPFPTIIKVWFAVDAIVALAPPLYWWADRRTDSLAGIPAALSYFLAVDLFIASSIVAACLMTRSETAAS